MKKAKVSVLNTNEETFYAATEKGWAQCSLEQPLFIKFNDTYTPEYIKDAQAALQAARNLPNLEARRAVQTRMRAILNGALLQCSNLVQNLYTIIARAFPDNQIESMRQEAGSGYYQSATSNNWNSAATLLNMANAFIATYNEALMAGKMPADFPAQLKEATNAYNNAFGNYAAAKDNLTKGGNAKQTANNAVYDTLLQMLSDGKAIFRNNAAVKKFFTFSELVKMVSGTGKTGIRIKLQQEVTLLPVGNATITAQPGNYLFYTDEKGIAQKEMPGGKYTVSITTPGMKTIVHNIKISTGVTRRSTFILQKATEAAAAVAS